MDELAGNVPDMQVAHTGSVGDPAAAGQPDQAEVARRVTAFARCLVYLAHAQAQAGLEGIQQAALPTPEVPVIRLTRSHQRVTSSDSPP